MKVLFSNAPWWEEKEWKYGLKLHRVGVRGGSRWPFTHLQLKIPFLNIKKPFYFGDLRYPYEYLPPPYFLQYAASYVHSKTNASVVLRDSVVRKETLKDYFKFLEEEKFDAIIFETATPSWDNDVLIINQMIKKFPNMSICLAGPVEEKKFLKLNEQNKNQLTLIKGEYEKNSLKFVEGKRGIIDYDLLTKKEMNEAPWPFWEEKHATWYYDTNPRGGLNPRLHTLASRGCPYKCIFCVWPATLTGNDPYGDKPRSVRYYEPEYLEPYIAYRFKKNKFKSVWFDDDTFNLGKNHTIKMCEMMQRLKKPWFAMCRIDTIKKDIWKLMKESGCVGVKVGIESGNQYVVDNIVNKHLDLEYTKEIVNYLVKELKMSVHGTFTVGLPGETKSQMLETIKYANSLPFTSKQISGTSVIAGTPISKLEQEEKMEKFSGAEINDEFIKSADGGKKYQEITKNLQIGKPLY